MRFFKMITLALLALAATQAFAVEESTLWLRDGNGMALRECGGFLRTTIRNGQANLVFQNVRACSNFDILSKNGQFAEYSSKKIPGPNGDRSGSFTLPKKVISYGFNFVKVIVKSNSGAHADVINLYFNAW
jgi:hypothetical protein